MKRYISTSIRKEVAQRASYSCEYCRLHQDNSFLPFAIEHIVSVKHGGGDEIENLALACQHCNQHKGTDMVTFLGSYDDVVLLYHPRLQEWFEHFSAEKGLIIPKTRIGEATIKLLQMNDPERVIHRQLLQEDGFWP